MEVDKWLDATQEYHLTIKDICEIPVGESIDIFFMDRNVLDTSADIDYNQPNENIDPQIFFRNSYFIKFTKREANGILGDWEWYWDGKQNVQKIDAYGTNQQREFDINYNPTNWYPLKNNKLPKCDSQGFANFGAVAGQHYSTFNAKTRLGWRGPMMLRQNIKKMPYVFWSK